MRSLEVAATLILLLSSMTTSAVATCAEQCNLDKDYCDKFESQCRPCHDLCVKSGKLQECQEKCEGYMRSAIFYSNSSGEDLRTIQILLAVLLAVTATVLLLLVVLVVLKLRGRKKSRKEVLPMGEFVSSKRPAPPTVTTQLSEEPASSTLSRRNQLNLLQRSRAPVPSEDCVLSPEEAAANNSSYDNAGMSGGTDNVSPNRLVMGNGRPYTISHSRVV